MKHSLTKISGIKDLEKNLDKLTKNHKKLIKNPPKDLIDNEGNIDGEKVFKKLTKNIKQPKI